MKNKSTLRKLTFFLASVIIFFGFQSVFSPNTKWYQLLIVFLVLFIVVTYSYTNIIIEIVFSNEDIVTLRSFRKSIPLTYKNVFSIDVRMGNRGFVTVKHRDGVNFLLRGTPGLSELINIAQEKNSKIEIIRN